MWNAVTLRGTEEPVVDIISPLQYCALREQDGGPCDTFASLIVEGLPCCTRCGERLMKALEDEGVTLVTRLEALDKKDSV